MAGIKYLKNTNEVIDMTGSEYTGVSNQQHATVFVKTGAAANATVKYGLTTDVTASAYSPEIKLSGSKVYIASQFSSSTEETTGTSYHTTTSTYEVQYARTRSSTYTSNTQYPTYPATVYYQTTSAHTYYYITGTSRTAYRQDSVTSSPANATAGATASAYQKAYNRLITYLHNYNMAVTGYNTYATVGVTRCTGSAQVSGSEYTKTSNASYTSPDYYRTSSTSTGTATSYATATRKSTYEYYYITYTDTYTTRTEYLTTSSGMTSNNCNV